MVSLYSKSSCKNKLKGKVFSFDDIKHFFQLYKGKEKRGKEEEVGTLKAEKELLLWLVRLFRMEPAFAFSVSIGCLKTISQRAKLRSFG